MKQQFSPSKTVETGLKFKVLSHTSTLLKQISNQQSSRSMNSTIISNNMHISEQLRLAKQESYKFLNQKCVSQTSDNKIDLSEFILNTKNKQLARQKLEKDRKEQFQLISKVREDVSHFYDPIKSRKCSDSLLDDQMKASHPKKFHKRNISVNCSPQLSILDMNEYLKLESSLNTEIATLRSAIPTSRVQTIKLKEWYDKQKQEDNQISVLSVTISELIKQIKVECLERGQLVEEVWNKVVEMVNEMKYQTDMIVQKDKIKSLDEYARLSKMYSYENVELKQKLQQAIEQYENEEKKHQITKRDYKELEEQFGKMRAQLNDIKKIATFLTKKLKQSTGEIDLLTKKLQNEKKYRHSAMPDQNQQPQFFVKQRNSIFQKIDSQQNSVQQSEQQKEKSQQKIESSSEEEQDDVIDGLLDEKNIIEMDNMVMNMDKIITVACFEQITGEDFLLYATRQAECQTVISMIKPDFDKYTMTQTQFDFVFEQQKLRQNINEIVQQYEEKLKHQSQRSMNQFVQTKFFQRKDFEIQSHLDIPEIEQEADEKSRIQKSSIDIQIRSPFESLVDLEKIKTLIELLSNSEQQNKQKDQRIIELMNQVKELQFQNNEMKNKLTLFQDADMYNVMVGKDQIKKEQQQLEQYLESQKSEQKIFIRKREKKLTQARLIFKGPQLGQKVAIVYEFQKQNAGPLLIEKIKSKTLPKIKHFMPLKLLLKQISVIYTDRIAQQKDNNNIKEQDMASFVYSYFLSQFGIKKIAEQKFLILVVSVKHHKSIIRINNFAKFLNLFDPYVNYNNDEIKRYLEAYDYVTNISQLGIMNQDQEQEVRYMIPYLRVVQYIGVFADSRMTSEEKEDLRKELDLLKENDPKPQNKQHLIDFDQFMITLFAKYKILVSRAKEYVINAFAACDLDGNGMCNFEEWFLLLRHIEPDRLTNEQISEIFFANADLLVKGEQNFSFEKFAVICVEFNLFSEESQNEFLGIKGSKTEIMSQFAKLLDQWSSIKTQIEQRFDQIVLLDTDRLEQWRQIIATLEKKIFELKSHQQQVGIEKRVKPLLIANLLLQRESIMLLELQNDYEEESQSAFQSNQSIRINKLDSIKEV